MLEGDPVQVGRGSHAEVGPLHAEGRGRGRGERGEEGQRIGRPVRGRVGALKHHGTGGVGGR